MIDCWLQSDASWFDDKFQTDTELRSPDYTPDGLNRSKISK